MMQIGTLQLHSNLFLSPLAGYTNLPFRLTVREIGGMDLATTDLVNARSLLEKKEKALRLIATCAQDTPLAVQLFGARPEEMRDAALYLESTGVASVDINMGCPVRKVCQVGGGSAMMTELARTARLVQTMAGAVRIPVTAKMRLGWDEANITAPDLARALEDAGIAAVFVHGRTRQQGFSGAVNLEGIRAVVRAVRRIPVVGNGDVTTPEAARLMMERTGCAGVSIGRGAFYNPWIFRNTRHYLDTGQQLPEPTFQERLRVMCRHLDRMVEVFGERQGCVMFRKVAPWYAKQFGPAKVFHQQVVTISSRTEFQAVLERYRLWREQFLDQNGELQPKYRPLPLREPFMAGDPKGEPGSGRAIAAPKGPVDNW